MLESHQQVLAFTFDDSKEAMRANFLAGATEERSGQLEATRFSIWDTSERQVI